MHSGSIFPPENGVLYYTSTHYYRLPSPYASIFLHQPSFSHRCPCIMKFNHFSLISHFVFSSVSSWTRLGSSQSEDIISDYNSCGRQPLSQILARKCQHSIWVPSAAFVIIHCRSKGGVVDGCMHGLLNGPTVHRQRAPMGPGLLQINKNSSFTLTSWFQSGSFNLDSEFSDGSHP